MKLLTKKIIEQAQKQYKKSNNIDDQMIVAKFFNPMGSWTWYLMNLHKDKDYAWGIVDGDAVEMGSWLMSELQDYKGRFGLGIERDIYFKPIQARQLWEELNDDNR